MHSSEMLRTSLKTLALAMLLPVITGFDNEKPPAGTQATPKDAPGFELQQKTPESPPRPGEPGGGSKLRRDKEMEPNPIDLTGPNAAAAKAGLTPRNVLSWETGAGKSYLIPALEVPGFLGLLNIHDRIAYSDRREDGKKVYASTGSTVWEHLSEQHWIFDKDPFNVNQFAHPYQGATMYGLARSSGLSLKHPRVTYIIRLMGFLRL